MKKKLIALLSAVALLAGCSGSNGSTPASDVIPNGDSSVPVSEVLPSDASVSTAEVPEESINVPSHTVSFVTDEEGSITTQEVSEGDRITAPAVEKEGYRLKGWTCNGEEVDLDTFTVSGDTTLEAEWEAIEYTITIDFDSTKLSITYPATAHFGDLVEIQVEEIGDAYFYGLFEGDEIFRRRFSNMTLPLTIKMPSRNLNLVAESTDRFVTIEQVTYLFCPDQGIYKMYDIQNGIVYDQKSNHDYYIPGSINGYPMPEANLDVFYNYDCAPSPKTLKFGDGVKRVVGGTYPTWWYLESIEFNSDIEEISPDLFGNLFCVNEIIVPEDCTTYSGDGTYIVRNEDDALIGTTDTFSGTIPSCVKKIGARAFSLRDIDEVTIPDNVTEIEDNAFFHSHVRKINISKSTTEFTPVAFSECYHLKTINVEDGNPVYDSRENCGTLIETATNTAVKLGKESVIPESVTDIDGRYAYSSCGNEDISIPDHVKRIVNNNDVLEVGVLGYHGRYYDFYDDTEEDTFYLKSLHIGAHLEKIAVSSQMYASTTIEGITVSEENPYYDSRDDSKCLIETATDTLLLAGKDSVIPDSIKRIRDFGYSYLESNVTEKTYELPSSVTEIDSTDFQGERFFYLFWGAFSNNQTLENIIFDDNLETLFGTIGVIRGLKTIYIPSGVTTIGAKAIVNRLSSSMLRHDVDVYCGSESKPEGWDDDFCYDYELEDGRETESVFHIHWGVSKSDYLDIISEE